MTNVPEAVLAREAGLCYGALAVASNVTCGPSPTPISHDGVRAAMRDAGASIMSILRRAIEHIPATRQCTCSANTALVV
jgi:5'-methylthioadenosine phosphorylase